MKTLTVGQKLTIFSISEMMANTQKNEVIVKSVCEPVPQRGYVSGPVKSHRVGTYCLKGKRKAYYLDIRIESFVFDGWNLPIKTDGEAKFPDGNSGFHGNACFNFSGDPAVVRDYIENRNLNETTDAMKAKCLLIPVDADGFRTGGLHDGDILLYPEIETRHAIIERMKGGAE